MDASQMTQVEGCGHAVTMSTKMRPYLRSSNCPTVRCHSLTTHLESSSPPRIVSMLKVTAQIWGQRCHASSLPLAQLLALRLPSRSQSMTKRESYVLQMK